MRFFSRPRVLDPGHKLPSPPASLHLSLVTELEPQKSTWKRHPAGKQRKLMMPTETHPYGKKATSQNPF